jgi:NAD(P)H-dependent FMN reductase
MNAIDLIAEDRIRQAIGRGEFQNLPGTGEPLALDDDLLVPAEVRVAYRVLKNAGFVPPAVALRKEISELESLVCAAPEYATYRHALAKLSVLRLKLAASGDKSGLRLEARYFRQIVARLGN